ncbi:amidase [Streptomyces sp. 150FB]|uniref:N-acetylmuramoyl-L-alanine amidase n=1 Tax=Streptomyces sp. 150FB TaxID=1576605 RepID=UPI0005895BA7|nr:N-acetylmuramoyl-L-alanine amidase [Streptomyces sp. 150FB]KIF78473.1 amidase [Streptomyces sp. 150FB]
MASAALLLPLIAADPSAPAEQPASGALQREFAAAARQYRVPADVLLGVSYLQSRWDTHGGAPSVSGGYGPMHLTDVTTALAGVRSAAQSTEDARGDTSRPARTTERPVAATPSGATDAPVPARLRTLESAARLTGLPADTLRQSPEANVRGGAALLAAAQKDLGRPPSGDPADWYGAVARFSGADDAATAAVYADDVFAVIKDGERRTTDSGQRVTLAATPGLTPDTSQVTRLGLRKAATGPVECPRTVACEWIPAPYEEFGDGDYGNHDKADRPASQSVDSIVLHDTEGSWDTTIKLVQDPTYVSWHYTLRSSDGHVAQHVALKDVAWHAGNWYTNAKSVGIEQEGFLVSPDAWFTEAMYRTSARLVKYLADRYDIPLDRQHILGHDNVPGTTATTIAGMHTDPGPYWDWAHYFQLLGKPFTATARANSGVVTIRPDYAANQPVYTGCVSAAEACAPHGSAAVRLHTAPAESAPLVKDIGLRPGGDESTIDVNDGGARATTGQQYAVAGRQGDWTAIWYLGQKAWFNDPARHPTAVHSKGTVLTPKPGPAEVPVYGRAYPEASAYPAGVPVQAQAVFPYKLLAGQRYVVGDRVPGEYLYAPTFDTSVHRVVRGKEMYYEIQFGHRVAYVKAADVRLVPAPR